MGTSSLSSCPVDNLVDLLIGGFFFAVPPCKIVLTKTPGKTKTIRIRDVVFRDTQRHILSPTNPMLLTTVEFVSITWQDQTNGLRMDTQTQRRTNNSTLCLTRLARAVQPIIKFVPDWTPETLLCSYQCPHKFTTTYVTDAFTLSLL